MAVRTSNTTKKSNEKKSNHTAIVNIIGTLDSVYVGKKYAYATIKVNDGDYYSLFKVAYPLDYDFPNDGDDINCSAEMKSFKGQISFYAFE